MNKIIKPCGGFDNYSYNGVRGIEFNFWGLEDVNLRKATLHVEFEGEVDTNEVFERVETYIDALPFIEYWGSASVKCGDNPLPSIRDAFSHINVERGSNTRILFHLHKNMTGKLINVYLTI